MSEDARLTAIRERLAGLKDVEPVADPSTYETLAIRVLQLHYLDDVAYLLDLVASHARAVEGRAQDTWRGGQPMAQYAVLGIGPEAWVELKEIEQRGIKHRNNDLSGMSISWRTFLLVMRVLKAIRLEDFEFAKREVVAARPTSRSRPK